MKQFKLTYLFTFLMSMVGATASADNSATITASDVTIERGKTADVTFTINSESFAAIAEFKLMLPQGVTIKYDAEEEDYACTLGSAMTLKSHTATIIKQDNGAFHVLVSNSSAREFKAASGDYLTITLEADETAVSGQAVMQEIVIDDLYSNKMNTVTQATFNVTVQELNYEFSAKNDQGINIQYRVVSEDDKTCEVFAKPYQQGETFKAAVARGTTGDVIIPAEANGYKVIGISSWAFYSCKKITSMQLPETMGYIGESAFRMATALQHINLPAGLTEIPKYCFSGATHLQKIDIPEGVTTIEYHAFANNYMLQSITIPSTVTTIAKTAFQHPRMLTKLVVKIADPIVLPDANFDRNRENTMLYVPTASVEAYLAHESWQGFKEVNGFYENGDVFTATNEQGIDIQYMVMDNQEMTCITYTEPYEEGKTFRAAIDQNTEGELIVPAEANGFRVISIGDWSFRECKKLTSVQLPATIGYIGASAFRMDRQLTSINIPEGVTSIGHDAFRGTRMEIIELPSTLLEVGEDAFVYISSQGIEKKGSCYFIANRVQPCELAANAIHYRNNYDLYVPKGCLEAYKNDEAWQGFRSVKEIGATDVQDRLAVGDLTVTVGKETTIDIYLTTDVEDYKGYQMSLSLPEGMKVATNDKGACIVQSGPDNEDLTVKARQQGDGSYQIVAYSLDGTPIKGGNNYLLRIAVTTEQALTAGTYTGRIENILLASTEASSTLVNVTFDITVEAAAEPGTRIFYADNVEAEPGQTVTMPIILQTEKAVDGMQFIATLPKGVTVKSVAMTSDHSDDFTLKCTQNGNVCKILVFSMLGESLPDHAGTVMEMTLEVNPYMEGGVYTAVLSDIMLAYADETDEDPADAYSTITVNATADYTPGDVNGDDEVNVRDLVMVIDYILGSTPAGFIKEAADMNHDGEVNVRDVIMIIDVILSE